jgi:hypothetical protein
VVQNAEPLMADDSQKAEVYYWEAVFLDKMGQSGPSQASWRRLLTLPEKAMSVERRNEAFLHLGIKPSSTPILLYTLTATETETSTPTP